MISARTDDDNPEPDWLASELFPESPPGLPQVWLTAAVELQMRRRLRQLDDLRRWLAERDAAETAEPIQCG